ncbi:collagenase [Microbulbifer marinus]|uniref:collagenase n=1 Tax=Microbulbifer marinus TaxID=658218 RepID=UPI001FCCD4E2|nr:collagenase [Microbulbifer marinus]
MLSGCKANLGEETWYQVESDNFRIVTNGDPAAVKTLAADLERYRAVALQLLDAPQDSQKLTIYAAADRKSYAGLVGEELAEMTNGLFDTTAQGSYALVNLDGRNGKRQLRAREFLFHEYTHFLSYNGNTTHYPYWYSEGFAEFMSTMTFTQNGGYQLGAIPEERAMTLIFASQMPLEKLLRATVSNTTGDEKAQVYASGWMLAHWLIMESGKVEQFKDYVKAYNNGADPVKALETSLGMSLAQIEEKYEAMFEKGSFNLVGGAIPADFREARPVVSKLAPRTAVAEIGHFLVMSGYNLDGLLDLLQYAHLAGVDSPKLTAVQADAETHVGNFERAGQLLASIPARYRDEIWYKNVDAWLGLNRQVNRPGDARSRDELKKVRDQFVFLVNNDSDTASHWYGLAMSMEMLDYPREKYVEMLEQAYLRAPRQVHIAQWLARELYEQQDAEFFAHVAQPLMLELESEEEFEQMKAMLAEMQGQKKSTDKARTTLARKEG